MLFSCTGTPEETTSTPAEESTAPPATVYTVAADGKTDYTFIRADRIDGVALAKALDLRRAIKEKYGVEIPITSDWSKDNKDNNTVTSDGSVREILVGDTNRAESREIAEKYSDMENGYVISAVNGKIVIWGSNADTLGYGLEYFTSRLLGDSALTVEEGFTYVWDLTGEGMPIDIISKEYSIIYAQDDPDRVWNAAGLLVNRLEALSGAELSSFPDGRVESTSGKEILIGNTDRPESQAIAPTLSYHDYTVRVLEDKIILLGGSPLATEQAVTLFTDLLTTGKISDLESGYVYDYDFDALIADSLVYSLDSFVPVWADEFTPAEWLTDYEEKLYALTATSGRMTVDAHRGDMQNYPEDSLEGILSAIMMGADVVEIDIRLTKDNVMVLMHDATLKRTTDWSEKAGKNGLPSSANIADWTYEELCELRLLYDGKATDCMIPTMYEAAQLFAGRAQIHFDCKLDTIDKNTDVYLLAEATGSKESFFYYYGFDTMQTWLGKNRDDEEFKAFIAKVRGYLVKNGQGLRKRDFSLLSQYGDHPEGWQKQYDAGKKMVVTNKIYDFCKYVSENQEAIPIS